MEKQEIINKLLKLIAKEMENMDLVNQFKNNPEELINTYFLMCSGEYANLEIVDLQNKLYNLKENNFIEFNNLKKVNKNKFKNYSMLVCADYAMVFSTRLMENVEADSLDNYIILNAGIQIKQEMIGCIKQNGYVLTYKKPYIVDGYHLPCKKLIKILYPKKEDLEEHDFENLFESVKNSLSQIKTGATMVVDMSTCVENKKVRKQILQLIKTDNKNKKIKIKYIV